MAVGDGERARGRGLEVEEGERGGGPGQDGDGVAGEAEDEVGGAVLLALDLVGEVQLARRRHGRPEIRVLGRRSAEKLRCGAASRGSRRDSGISNCSEIYEAGGLAWYVSVGLSSVADLPARRRRRLPGGD